MEVNMLRFSQIAAPAVVAGALMLGSGCGPERCDEIPARAEVVGEGTRTVTANAPGDGTVYVWDKTANKMIYTGKVERGDVVTVDAHRNRVLFNDKTALDRNLIDDHNYKVFF